MNELAGCDRLVNQLGVFANIHTIPISPSEITCQIADALRPILRTVSFSFLCLQYLHFNGQSFSPIASHHP